MLVLRPTGIGWGHDMRGVFFGERRAGRDGVNNHGETRRSGGYGYMTLQMIPKPEQQTPSLNRQEWTRAICSRWHETVRAFLEVGGMLIDAKTQLAHGEFGEMIERDLPFGSRTAQRLMAVAQHPSISNA